MSATVAVVYAVMLQFGFHSTNMAGYLDRLFRLSRLIE
jgi:hypothetical protein